ncbi:hypothetical protein IV203_030560 [Nitzschia inconspicua]|uniref:Uncharacterized protein n=1 Tax=Nitzschia inconspicua TaxID=303405 RepID=A0A9K3LTB4_9STRA|nr:hypothetical protein IV203_022896 [Nitzschia inconspicua]KAG7367817.1 hypothetical protein IV203_030560 [Nitzschia inconspicua]
MKEIQDVICFRAYDAVQGLGDSYSQAQLQELAFQKYHGSGEDSHGLAEKFMNGIEMFQGIYHDEMNRVTQRSEKVLDTIYHLRHDKRIVSDPNPAIKGLRVQAAGRKVLAYCKKSSKYSDPNTKVSGEQWEDYLKFCRYKMWKESQQSGSRTKSCPPREETSGMQEQNSADVVGDVEDDDILSAPPDVEEKDEEKESTEDLTVELTTDEEEAAIKDWNSSWIFPGYMAWALWGHIPKDGLEEYKADSFATSDSCTRKKGGASAAGRKSMRKAAAKVEDQKRETSMLDGSGSGIGGQESLKLKTFALRAQISTAMTTTSIVSKYNAMKVSLDKWVALISNRKNSMEKLVFQKPECFDDHEHYYATYVPYKVYMDCETELQELTDQYTDLDDQMLAEIEAINPKNETTSGRKRDSRELSASPTNDLSNEVIFLDDESETAQLTYNDD